MLHCPNCGEPVPEPLVADDSAIPDSRASEPGESSKPDWVSVGRFANLAEVGYFSDLFSSRQIASQTRQHDQFCATDGSWQAIYILQVPERLAPQAIELVRSELGREDTDSEIETWPEATAVSTSLPWSPGLARTAILMLIVGGLAYCAGQAGRKGQPSDARGGPPLWKTLVEIDGTLVTQPTAPTQYQVRANRDSETVVIQRDTDGDGRFERWREYNRGRLAVD